MKNTKQAASNAQVTTPDDIFNDILPALPMGMFWLQIISVLLKDRVLDDPTEIMPVILDKLESTPKEKEVLVDAMMILLLEQEGDIQASTERVCTALKSAYTLTVTDNSIES